MRLASVLLGLPLLLASLASAEDVLVAHPSVQTNEIDQPMLRDLFLGRRTTWPNGQRVVVVMLRGSTANDRLAAALGKTPQQLINWWKRLVFTGEGNMPEQVESDEQLAARVAAIPGAIGWIDRRDVPPTGVKVLPTP